VLPKRFVKVHYYGFFHPRKRDRLERVKELFGLVDSDEKNAASGGCLAAEASPAATVGGPFGYAQPTG